MKFPARRLRSKGGLVTNQRLPREPLSSAAQARKRTERRGAELSSRKDFAKLRMAAVPAALSQAPLKILSSPSNPSFRPKWS